jgi:hypothetical protein
MGCSWSGFHPQNKSIKLQWALLEASQLPMTAKELARLLALSDLMEQSESENDEASAEDGPSTPSEP